jgi:uncharacterized protein YuzE
MLAPNCIFQMKPLLIRSSNPPIVEIDTAARAAYIRFKTSKVAKTISEDTTGPVVAIDLDENGEVVGVELVGVGEFTLRVLLRIARVKAPNIALDRAKYVPASQPAAA